MNVSIILGHPHPGSFNHAIAHAAAETLRRHGHTPAFHDLYAEKFDPILPYGEIDEGAPLPPLVQQHCAEIAEAEGIVIVHPNWWGGPPAIMKGWMDRVLRPGVAYRFDAGDSGGGVPIGLLKARAAIVFNTSNTPRERELAAFGDPLERVWKDCTFDLCGVKNFRRRTFGVVITSTLEQRRAWLREVEEIVSRTFKS